MVAVIASHCTCFDVFLQASIIFCLRHFSPGIEVPASWSGKFPWTLISFSRISRKSCTKAVFWWKSKSILIVAVVGSGKAVEMSARRGKGRQSILITDFFSSLFHQKQKETSVADSDAVDNIWIIPQKVDALKNLTTCLKLFFPFRWVLTVQVFTLVSSLWYCEGFSEIICCGSQNTKVEKIRIYNDGISNKTEDS